MSKKKNLYAQNFGVKLKLLRTQKEMSRDALTKKVGCTSSFVAKVEDGNILDPSLEYKKKFYKALNLNKEEIDFLENNPRLYFYEENNEAILNVSVPTRMNLGGKVSRKLLDEYINGISDDNLYVLLYCAQTIYNFENPDEVKEELKNYNKSLSDYDNKWRVKAAKERSEKLHNDYNKALKLYLKNKIKNGENTITAKEIMENIKPPLKASSTNTKIRKLCEEGRLIKTQEGKRVFYKINKRYYNTRTS